jgi:hypothetical protein
MCGAIGRRIARATTLRSWSGHLGIFTIIIIVLVDVHVTRCRLVLLRPFLFRSFRHTRRRWCRTHCGKRRRVVRSFRRMVTIVELSSVWGNLRAVTGNLRRRGWVRRSWPAAVRLLQLLALLFVGRRLWVDVVVIFPLAVTLRRCSGRTIIPIACSSFGSDHSRWWGRSTACDPAASRAIRMMVWTLITGARGASAMLNDWSNFRWRAGWTPIWEGWSLVGGLRRWSSQARGWRRWWWRYATSMRRRTVVGVRDAVGLWWLLLVVHRRRLGMNRLWCELWWRGMVRARSNMVCLWRRRHATTHRSTRARRGRTNGTRGPGTVGRRARRLAVRPRGLLSRANRPLGSMLSGRTNAIALLVGIQLLGRQSRVTDLSQRSVPSTAAKSWRCRTLRWLLGLRSAPLGSSWSVDRSRLVGLRMDVARHWCSAVRSGCR